MAKVKIDFATVFERHEKKYLLTQIQYRQLMGSLAEHMRQDQYGLHTVCSLYFDTEDFLLIRRSLEKPKYKEKLRLRSYGIPSNDDIVFLELKKKLDGVTYKRRVAMPLYEVEQYIRYGSPPEQSGQIADEICWFIQRYQVTPKVLLFYDRIALYDITDCDLRVTFDTNIRWRDERLDFANGDYGAQLLPPGEHLMEIKLTGAFPCWLSRLLSEQKIYPVSFSKYGMVYRELIHKEGKRHVG